MGLLKRLLILALLGAGISMAATLEKGIYMVTYDANTSLDLTNANVKEDMKGKVAVVYGISANHQGYVSFNPDKPFNSLKTLEKGSNYILILSETYDMPGIIKGIGVASDNCVSLEKGINFVNMPAISQLDADIEIHGVKPNIIYGVSENHQGYVSFNPDKPFNSLKEIKYGLPYLIFADEESGEVDEGMCVPGMPIL